MKPRTIFLLILAGLIAILIIQNSASANVRLFFWTIRMPMVLLVPIFFFLGFAAGFWRAHFGPRREKRSPHAVPPSPPVLPPRS